MRLGLLGLAVLCMLPISCAKEVRPGQVAYLVQENVDYAKQHAQRNELEEAAQLFQGVLVMDPANKEAKEGLDKIPTRQLFFMKPSWMGINRVNSGYPRSNPALWIVLYPVNRVMDVLDCFSFHFGLEGGLYANVHFTRAVSATAGGGGGIELLGWRQKRELAMGSSHVAGLGVGPFSVETDSADRVGTRGVTTTAFRCAGVNRPSDFGYQRYRDYWGLGARFVVLLVGVHCEVHPIELSDAVSSFFFLDFLHDDWGHCRGLKLKRFEVEALQEMLQSLPADELNKRLRRLNMTTFQEPSQAK